MKEQAIAKANKRLKETWDYYDDVCSAHADGDSFEHAWSHFLVSGNRCLTALFAGAESGDEQSWKAETKKEVRADKLLTYMRESRNEDEHEEEFVAKLENARPPHLDMTAILPGGRKMRVYSLHLGTYTLKDAVREGVTYPVPTDHLGAPISNHPSVIGNVWARWLKNKIKEAEAFPRT